MTAVRLLPAACRRACYDFSMGRGPCSAPFPLLPAVRRRVCCDADCYNVVTPK